MSYETRVALFGFVLIVTLTALQGLGIVWLLSFIVPGVSITPKAVLAGAALAVLINFSVRTD